MVGPYSKNFELLKNETKYIYTTLHKTNFKWIRDLNLKPETLTLLEENLNSILAVV